MKNWLLVANAARARVLELTGVAGEYRHVADLVHPQSRQKGIELADDRPGHGEGSPGPGGVAYVPRTDPRERERDRFAREIAKLLDAGVAAGECAGLTLVASNPFLGEVKQRLTPAPRSLSTRHLDPHGLDAPARCPQRGDARRFGAILTGLPGLADAAGALAACTAGPADDQCAALAARTWRLGPLAGFDAAALGRELVRHAPRWQRRATTRSAGSSRSKTGPSRCGPTCCAAARRSTPTTSTCSCRSAAPPRRRRWEGRFSNYQRRDGMLVPLVGEWWPGCGRKGARLTSGAR